MRTCVVCAPPCSVRGQVPVDVLAMGGCCLAGLGRFPHARACIQPLLNRVGPWHAAAASAHGVHGYTRSVAALNTTMCKFTGLGNYY